MHDLQTRYLERLSELYPTIAAASMEVINLEAILNLPKGTEHFLTDVHGEYEAFAHVLKNGSGAVRRKVNEVFGTTLSDQDKRTLATLIYYPREKMARILAKTKNKKDWYKITLYRLIAVSKRAASKYTRSKVRKALPPEFAYVIEELITEKDDVRDKESYYDAIVQTIIRLGRAEDFIAALCELIQRLVVDHLHILGDIYDRGPGPHIIMDDLMAYHSVDVQWGNHDVLWMGAATGQRACIANALRICARYGNLDILEEGYGINLLPLATFAMQAYENDPCTCFALNGEPPKNKNEREMNLQMSKEHPEFGLEGRALLHRIDYERGVITLDGKEYKLLDMNFPTVDPKDPYRLSDAEEQVMERLENAFQKCEKLQEHMRFLLAKGSLYKVYNGNLLFHGCVPLNENGSFREVELYGHRCSGRSLYEFFDEYIRKGFVAEDLVERKRGRDLMWYIWLHENSPLFGKTKMATFERYFLAEKETHREKKNPYYTLIEDEEVANRILEEFGLSPEDGHIINGHVPVKTKNGESPVKCGGKVLVIDGGFSRAYQKETGIAGYTLIYNSYGLILAAHKPFESTESAIENESDIHSDSVIIQRSTERELVGDTDSGRKLKADIADLEYLLEAYRSGRIIEKFPSHNSNGQR